MTDDDYDFDPSETHDDPKCEDCGLEMKWDGEQWKCNCLELGDEWEVQPQVKRRSATGMDGAMIKPSIAVMAPVSPALKEKIKRAAGGAGVSVSEWLRILIVKELKCG